MLTTVSQDTDRRHPTPPRRVTTEDITVTVVLALCAVTLFLCWLRP